MSHPAGGPLMKRLPVVDEDVESLAVARVRPVGDEVETSCATGAREGLEAAKSPAPDMILLELDMPGMTGFDACGIFKADLKLGMIPVRFLSGSGSSDNEVRGLDLGAVDYITKPFDDFEVRATGHRQVEGLVIARSCRFKSCFPHSARHVPHARLSSGYRNLGSNTRHACSPAARPPQRPSTLVMI